MIKKIGNVEGNTPFNIHFDFLKQQLLNDSVNT